MATNVTMKLANGHDFLTRTDITSGEATGLAILVFASSASLVAVISLFTAIGLSAWNTRKSTNEFLFVRSQQAAYLGSLLLCDFMQAVGSLMNGKWNAAKQVTFEPYCTAQGAIKQFADIGIAMWALVIAIHTFWVLFMEWRIHRYVMWGMLIFMWSMITTFVIAGPATATHDGPFYGITGYWCWISDQYPTARVVLDYAFMWFSAIVSFILYALILLKLRGNILLHGGRFKVRKHHDLDSLRGYSADDSTIAAAKAMLFYPVSYTIIILPITVCRFLAWSGVDIPFTATIFCDVIYLLSGFVNVMLFLFMRRVLPRHSVITRRFGKSKDEEQDHSMFDDVPTLQGGDESSYMSEKLAETHEDEKEVEVEKDSKMFVIVDSPDAEAFVRHQPVPEEPLVPPSAAFARTPATAASGMTSPGTAFSQSSPSVFARISLDSMCSPGSRAQFPASAGGMAYPQSPIAPLASARIAPRSPLPPRSPMPPRSPLNAARNPQTPHDQAHGFKIITEE